MDRQGDEIIPCTLVWSSSSLSMRRRISTTADDYLPPMEKRCNVMKTIMPKPQSALNADEISARRNIVAAHRNLTEAKRPSRY